jgi:hypothetical protein
VLQNNRAVTSPVNRAWNTTVYGTEARSGVLSENLGLFDVLVGLSYWGVVGRSARLEAGNVPGIPQRQAFYASVVRSLLCGLFVWKRFERGQPLGQQ